MTSEEAQAMQEIFDRIAYVTSVLDRACLLARMRMANGQELTESEQQVVMTVLTVFQNVAVVADDPLAAVAKLPPLRSTPRQDWQGVL